MWWLHSNKQTNKALNHMSLCVRKPTIWVRPGSTQTGLYSHRRWHEAGNFGLRKKNCTICVVKTKALISLVVTAKLICAFVFAFADCWFSHAVAHKILSVMHKKKLWILILSPSRRLFKQVSILRFLWRIIFF